MFEITTPTEAALNSVTPRTETHGEDKVFAISLGLAITGANTMLDALSPTLRHALYMAAPGQDQLPGVDPATPLLRCKVLQEVKVGPSALEGWTLFVDHGIDESEPITLGGCKVDKFCVLPSEGGTVTLKFRVGSNDVDATEAGLLCSHLGQTITITLKAPEKIADKPVIDGSVGHPGAAAAEGQSSVEDLFAAAADAEPDEDAGPDLEDRLDNALQAADDEQPAEPERGENWPFPNPYPKLVDAHANLPVDETENLHKGAAEQAELEAGMAQAIKDAGVKAAKRGRKAEARSQ